MNSQCTDFGDDLQSSEYPQLADLYAKILTEIDEDPQRQGLIKTPDRAAEAIKFMTQGYHQKVADILNNAMFDTESDDIVIVRDIEFYSLCLPSKQLVDAVGRQKPAADVQVGTELYTLHEGQRTTTRVVSKQSRKARELVELTPRRSDGTHGTTIRLTPEHPVMTPEGWREAGDLRPGDCVEFTPEDFGIDLEIQNSNPNSEARPVKQANGIWRMYVSNRWAQAGWYGRHGFSPEVVPYELKDSSFVPLAQVARMTASGKKPFTVYSFQCDPYPTFCVSGILTHNCEHHLLPIFGKCHVAYIPDGKIIGLSKIPRLVDMFARRLQVQERLTYQIAHALQDVLKPLGVAVVMEAQHMCMMIRGVQKQNSRAITSSVLGVFRDDPSTKAEWMSLLQIS